MTAPAAAVGRPTAGVGHYLRDLVYGAIDGTITTLAVVAGVTGASFPGHVGLVLGLANLVADGLSMAASNYLGIKSELEQSGGDVAIEQPWRHAMATWAAFVIAGGVPLLCYLVARGAGARLVAALVLSLLTLTATGAARARFIQRPAWRCAVEVVLIGGGAAAAAYAIGGVMRQLVAP